MNDLINKEENSAWYRNSYVWLIIFFPLSAVLAGFYTLYLSIVSYDGLVADDYYKEGLSINKRLEKQRHADELMLQVKLEFNEDNELFSISLTGNDTFEYPESLQVMLSHSTREGYDQQVNFKRSGDTLYTAFVSNLQAGNWNVIIEGGDWRLYDMFYQR